MGIHLLKGELAAKTILSSMGCASSGDRIIANTPFALRYLNSLPGNVKDVRCAWLWNITIQWHSHLKSSTVLSSSSHQTVRVWHHSERLFLEIKCCCLSKAYPSTPNGLCCLSYQRAIIICQLLQLSEKTRLRRQDDTSCIQENETHPQVSHAFLTILLHNVSYMLIIWVSWLGPNNI